MENIVSKIDSSYRHRAGRLEKTFGKVATGIMKAANPFKKMAFKTSCLMHRFINIKAVHILENEYYYEAADFYRDHIKPLNEGATWIDQDFKSINHFYHHELKKGLYGFSDALTETMKYREKMMHYAKHDNLTRALFYTGVICHLIQDMTVPQHINNRLLDSHRDYEQWILAHAWDTMDFTVKSGINRYPKFEMYISENARLANEIYQEARSIENDEEAFTYMSTRLIPLAQRTTAGLLLDFYEAWFSQLNAEEHSKRTELRQIKGSQTQTNHHTDHNQSNP
ncbi:MAG: zinc dependent phospholipase C family protein [Clostridiaceae bacterium]